LPPLPLCGRLPSHSLCVCVCVCVCVRVRVRVRACACRVCVAVLVWVCVEEVQATLWIEVPSVSKQCFCFWHSSACTQSTSTSIGALLTRWHALLTANMLYFSNSIELECFLLLAYKCLYPKALAP
jgi:hypothetical protein